jgi:hypothetical protein
MVVSVARSSVQRAAAYRSGAGTSAAAGRPTENTIALALAGTERMRE